MQFKSLESRIVTLFLALIILVQLFELLAVNVGIGDNAREAIRRELEVGERIFTRLLVQRAQTLTRSASILANDQGLAAAISDNDRPTIESALQNQGERIGAKFVLFVDAEQKIRAASGIAMVGKLEPMILPLLARAGQNDGANGIFSVDGQSCQIVAVPIAKRGVGGWVLIGFAIDKVVAQDMLALSGLDVAILRKGSVWTQQDATLAVAQVLDQIQGLPQSNKALPRLMLSGSEYGARLIPLGQGDSHMVVLLRSVSTAIAPYQRLEWMLFGMAVVGLLLSALASVLTAKRIAQPLQQLAGVARRLEQGDYSGQIDCSRNDEIGALSTAFTTMQGGIARREQEISRLAYWDTLTGLPNRVRFTVQLNAALATGVPGCILMMDLDRFKNVNDVLGHSVGDLLLQQLASRLSAILPPDAVVARFGGDEFAILLAGADLAAANQAATRVLAALEQPLTVEQQTIDVGAGLGIVAYPQHGQQAEALLSLAEVAMYYAKQHHSGAVVYDSRIDTSSEQNLSLLTELRHAAEHAEFRLFVQPKTAFADGQVVGLEALVRWVHPQRGMVFPDQFIPFAEQTGFICVLTLWMLEQSAALCQQLLAQGLHLKISVNLSTRDLLDQDLPQKFMDILARHQVEAKSFCLEITESAIMDDPVRAQTTLERLAALGVDLSIDDFGTGYSSLAYLKRLPVNELKIDKSFVLHMEHDQGDTKIVRSTIDLGHNMGLRVVAEGVENEAVWHMLAGLGCDQGQGYFMSRPMAAERLPEWIANWRAPQATPFDAYLEREGKA
jgi:diguanylate cyclase (GGDEF)-like protein